VNSLPPPIPLPPISRHPRPPSNDGSNFAGPLRYDRLAIASLVSGLFLPSLRFALILFAPFKPAKDPKNFAILILITPLVVAFVLGILALRRIKTQPERLKGRGMALAGMILGALPLLILLPLIAISLTGGMPF
jgi:hypothetical protein